MNQFDDNEDEFDTDFPDEKSKSQLKREMTALQDLGKKLAAYPAKRLQEIAMPGQLLDALLAAQKIKSHGALRRQLQFIGKVMRSVDTAPLEEFLAIQESRHHQQVAQLHRIETWRERLLEEGDQALDDLLSEAPQANLQQIRQLLRNAKREAETNKPPKSARALYQLLKEVLK